MMTSNFQLKFNDLIVDMINWGKEVDVGEWQSKNVTDNPDMVSIELRHVTFRYDLPPSVEALQEDMRPSMPWAEDHFQERVSGEPVNPPPSEEYWPYAVHRNAEHKMDEGKFSHTYPERMWPKYAGSHRTFPRTGIRFQYGDLSDVVDQLKKNPHTRQAYLPIWFPEDTGAVHGERVPCTLGYHFLIRNNEAEIVYFIRSCDLLRHFTDDAYMACRLLQWVVGMLRFEGTAVKASSLIMHISSLHTFRGDQWWLNQRARNIDEDDDGISTPI